jgi:hypothetical protein
VTIDSHLQKKSEKNLGIVLDVIFEAGLACVVSGICLSRQMQTGCFKD